MTKEDIDILQANAAGLMCAEHAVKTNSGEYTEEEVAAIRQRLLHHISTLSGSDLLTFINNAKIGKSLITVGIH